MYSLFNLGSYNISGTGLNRFNVPSVPKVKGGHLASLIFVVSVSGTASGAITKKQFLNGICMNFNLELNNKVIVDNLDGESLDYLRSRCGNQINFVHPSVSGAGSFDVDMYYSVDFESPLLLNPYDLCPSLNDISSLSFEFQKGSLSEISSVSIRLIAKVVFRENEYFVPQLKIRRFTISKQISDSVTFPNRVLYLFFQFPSSGSLDDSVVIRSKRNVFADNCRLKDLRIYHNPPVIYSDLQDSDYNSLYFDISPNRPLSLKKPLLYEQENLFFDDLASTNSPFNIVSVEVEPSDFASESIEFDSRFSPSKK